MKRPYGAIAPSAAVFRCEERGIVANRRPGPADRCRARPRRPAELRGDRGAGRALRVGGEAPDGPAVPRWRGRRLLRGPEPGGGGKHGGVRRAVLRGPAPARDHRAGARPASAGDRGLHREWRTGRAGAPPDRHRGRARRGARADPDRAPAPSGRGAPSYWRRSCTGFRRSRPSVLLPDHPGSRRGRRVVGSNGTAFPGPTRRSSTALAVRPEASLRRRRVAVRSPVGWCSR